MFTVDKFDPKTNKLTLTFDLSQPRKPETGKVMWMMGTTGGFKEVPGVIIDGHPLKLSANFGFKK